MSNRRKLRNPALGEQVQAAREDALISQVTMVSGMRNPQQGIFRPGITGGPMAVVLGKFITRDETNSFHWCKHLRADTPQPAVWYPWLADRLYCRPCVNRMPPLSSREDRRCDACGYIDSKITSHTGLIEPKVLPARRGKTEEIRPPVMFLVGLCPKCDNRQDAENERVSREVPAIISLPEISPKLTIGQAETYSFALTLTQTYDQKGKDGLGTLLEKWEGPVDFTGVIVALGHINCVVIEALIRHADNNDLTLNSCLADIGRGMAMITPQLNQGTAEAIRVIKAVSRDRAVGKIETVGCFPAMLMILISSKTPLAVMGLIAGLGDQYWEALRSWVDRNTANGQG